jgi:hypothetical protein
MQALQKTSGERAKTWGFFIRFLFRTLYFMATKDR